MRSSGPVRRLLVWLVAIAVWTTLLWLGILWDGREVIVPTISSPDVQTVTVTPEPDHPIPFPRSTLPPTWQRWDPRP